MRIVLLSVIVMLFTISMAQAKTIKVNMPGITSIALPAGWSEIQQQYSKLHQHFYDSNLGSLDIEYVERYKGGNEALKEILSKSPHVLDSAERRAFTKTGYSFSNDTELKTIVLNGQQVVCAEEPFHSSILKVMMQLSNGKRGCKNVPITRYRMFKPLENGYLRVEYLGNEIDHSSWDSLLRSIVWR